MTARIVGVGKAVPRKVLTNRDLEQIVETSDEWIVDRTGIRERRQASDDEVLLVLAPKPRQWRCKRPVLMPTPST